VAKPPDPFEGWIKFQAYYTTDGTPHRVSSVAAWCTCGQWECESVVPRTARELAAEHVGQVHGVRIPVTSGQPSRTTVYR
jgi:hypothetical protein